MTKVPETSPDERSRRTLRDIERFYSSKEVLDLIENGRPWPYKIDKDYFLLRDKALMCFIYLMACRINEALKVNKTQFDFKTDPEFIVVQDFKISKRTQKILMAQGIPKIDFGLPLVGELSPFTEKVMSWYYLQEKNLGSPLLFPGIGRVRAWGIIEYSTGKWCHWFRSQRLSYLMKTFRSETIVAKMIGIKAPGTISHYYKGSWAEHREELKK